MKLFSHLLRCVKQWSTLHPVARLRCLLSSPFLFTTANLFFFCCQQTNESVISGFEINFDSHRRKSQCFLRLLSQQADSRTIRNKIIVRNKLICAKQQSSNGNSFLTTTLYCFKRFFQNLAKPWWEKCGENEENRNFDRSSNWNFRETRKN